MIIIIALYIIVAVLLITFLFLFSNIHCVFWVDDEITLKIRFWIFTYKLLSQKKKSHKKKKKQLKKEEKQNFFGIIKDKSFTEIKDMLELIINIIIKASKKIFKYIFIDKINLNFIVVGNDAADTAIKYGYAYSGIYPVLQTLSYYGKINKKSIKLVAGFKEQKSIFKIKLKFRIRMIFLLNIVFLLFLEYIKYLKTKKKENNISKGGKKDERTFS